MSVKVYVEGGGDTKDVKITCQRGFRLLFEKAGFKGRMPAIVACGSRRTAFDRFKTALAGDDEHYPLLLVDSESAVAGKAWTHLKKQDDWPRPGRAKDDQAQLMVQCMETWCVADRRALREFFGQELRESALPAPDNLEARAKDDIQKALERATRTCGRDRAYRKGTHSFRLLAELDPDVLRHGLPHFVRLCDALGEKLNVNREM